MQLALLASLTALIVSLCFTPVVRWLAVKLKIFAHPNHRTVHKERVPKSGGLSIFLAFVAGLGVLGYASGGLGAIWGLVAGGGLVLVLGLLDDVFVVSCNRKLLVESVAAGVAFWSGYALHTVSSPFGTVELGIWSLPLSILWIVGITNAINLLDGLDGLAGGFSVLVAGFILVAAGFAQNLVLAGVALVFIAAILGFLRYNFPPARIFMGDTGSLFLGFCLACLSLQAFTGQESGTHLAVLFIPFGIPITDTFLAIARRLTLGKHPFSADRKHIHHRLLDLGLTQSTAVLVIYAMTFLCGVAGLVLLFVDVHFASLVIVGVVLFFLLTLLYLDCFDFVGKRRRRRLGVLRVNQKQNG
ncbi:undecaprenyl/decaprenyl-phosphate alpha-N-acetylglucosaminyl 1-phosphate transferase [Candidatus Parcubacteria bacterium]|nr:MAG: undecaprenyl/decaprenyl-phosphate alpha-N-acetylglucosaminyl 1-phosphate transferase [Candidatus Parcubacteria bacterium]